MCVCDDSTHKRKNGRINPGDNTINNFPRDTDRKETTDSPLLFFVTKIDMLPGNVTLPFFYSKNKGLFTL